MGHSNDIGVTACPHCGSGRQIPIVYGMPGMDLVEQSRRGEIVLGGCMVSPEKPVMCCASCGASWGRRGERSVEKPLSSRAVSDAGQQLVQQQLKKLGIDTAASNPREGYHLAVNTQRGRETIRVHANLAPKLAGGRGRTELDWNFGARKAADWIAFVDLSSERAWLFRTEEAIEAAQQHPKGGGHKLVMVTDPGLERSKHARILDTDFREFALERRAAELG